MTEEVKQLKSRIDQDSKANHPVIAQVTVSERQAMIEQSLKNMITLSTMHGKTTEDLKKCCSTLLMYVSNILDQPTVSRYRRIVTTNSSFKSLVFPIEGHQAFLESVGFFQRGSQFEWLWTATSTGDDRPSEPDAKLLLEQAKLGLQSICKNGNLESTSLSEEATTKKDSDILKFSEVCFQ